LKKSICYPDRVSFENTTEEKVFLLSKLIRPPCPLVEF